MEIDIISRRGNISPSVEVYAREKAEKLDRYLKKIARVEIILEHNAERYFAEMRVHADLKGTSDLVAHVDHEDARASIDLLMDKMERRLIKIKERRNSRHTGGIRKNDNSPMTSSRDEGDDLDDDVDKELK